MSCSRCKKHESAPGKAQCEDCLELGKEQARRRREEHRRCRRCSACGEEPTRDRKLCERCRLRIREGSRRYYEKHPEKARERHRRGREKDPNYGRRSAARQKYDLSLEEADRLRLLPCEACGRAGPNHIDHCHDGGGVRGTLCGACNRALGMLNESPARLEQLRQYIIKKSWKVNIA